MLFGMARWYHVADPVRWLGCRYVCRSPRRAGKTGAICSICGSVAFLKALWRARLLVAGGATLLAALPCLQSLLQPKCRVKVGDRRGLASRRRAIALSFGQFRVNHSVRGFQWFIMPM